VLIDGPPANRLFLASILALLSVIPRSALGHHNVGHGPSESLRVLNASGANPAPRQRAALLASVTRSTDEPALNTATTYAVSVLADIRVTERLYLNGQFPFVVVDEDSYSSSKPGYGDTNIGIQVPVGSLTQKAAASWVLSLNATMPTRTISYEADPGQQWTITPGFRYADNWKSWLWYGLLLAPVETRPAGTALDISPALGGGYRLTQAFSLTLGVSADIRALTLCKTFDGAEICSQGRATEESRAQGTTRAYAAAAATFDLTKNWSLFSGAQAPITQHKDIEWSFSIGAEARF